MPDNIVVPGAKPPGASYERYKSLPMVCGGCGKEFASLWAYTGHMSDVLTGIERVGDDEVHTWVARCLTPRELRQGGWKKDVNGVWHAPVPNG